MLPTWGVQDFGTELMSVIFLKRHEPCFSYNTITEIILLIIDNPLRLDL